MCACTTCLFVYVWGIAIAPVFVYTADNNKCSSLRSTSPGEMLLTSQKKDFFLTSSSRWPQTKSIKLRSTISWRQNIHAPSHHLEANNQSESQSVNQQTVTQMKKAPPTAFVPKRLQPTDLHRPNSRDPWTFVVDDQLVAYKGLGPGPRR